jgi:hypothetical protein
VNADPYGKGWLAKMTVTGTPDLSDLLVPGTPGLADLIAAERAKYKK